jgi:hypothetical protein
MHRTDFIEALGSEEFSHLDSRAAEHILATAD